MSHASTSKCDRLRDRAQMLSRARAFFSERLVCEVDVPLLSQSASIDAHIDLVRATCMDKICFLHSSPEYGMKRLLAEGMGDIFQISHVFRDHERGERHNPEFTMVEWYRVGMPFHEMIAETVDFVRLFLEGLPTDYEQMTYQEAFERYAGTFPSSLEQRDLLFSCAVEPHLGKKQITALCGFPPEQAALARVAKTGVAERFELFYHGVELANGYHELIQVDEQEKRLYDANAQRISLGKESYPIDSYFLNALKQGIPDCCGVAVGFDRLMMLRHRASLIDEVIPFGWGQS